MINWPLGYGCAKIDEIAVDATLSRGISVSSSAGQHGKGPWTTLVSSGTGTPPYDEIQISARSATSNNFCFDLAVGDAGQESAFCTNIHLPIMNSMQVHAIFRLPVAVSADQRISIRTQQDSSTGAKIIYFTALGIKGGELFPPGHSSMSSVGFNFFGATKPQAVDPGTTINTKGAWTTLVPADFSGYLTLTPDHYVGFIVTLNPDRSPAAGTVTISWYVDIAIGAAGAETVILSNMFYATEIGAVMGGPRTHGPFYIPIPSGTRVAARCQSNQSTAGERLLGVSLACIIGLQNVELAGNAN